VSPITGTITFQGVVAGRAVIVISDGRRSASLEPVTSSLDEGTFVRAGQTLGTVANGGHCTLRCVHLGLRLDGRYVNPFGVRARLVP
jgi:murein DD-endopeptidase MepM/ murein hydrolase activator NlpD